MRTALGFLLYAMIGTVGMPSDDTLSITGKCWASCERVRVRLGGALWTWCWGGSGSNNGSIQGVCVRIKFQSA